VSSCVTLDLGGDLKTVLRGVTGSVSKPLWKSQKNS
jgi:hypothetical protein